ncbi:unnamed protein product [Cylicostephanus goldi]|uniref:Neurotransmitter-gated ion-channel ligand-binding domain-containing protein n=1 Tax=Cylicostephanus goldi TaxID=71465 RepID=A0A3P6RV86_CYLGO|nr:unnamed protein product [Cylicostephanus goldi]
MLRKWTFKEWNDDRLTWNPSDFDGIEGIFINQNLLWKADIVIVNSRASTEMASGAQHAYVQSNGDITLFVCNTVSYLCLMNVKDFPFDKQVCSVEFASFAFLGHEIQLNCSIAGDHIDYFVSDLRSYHILGAFISIVLGGLVCIK